MKSNAAVDYFNWIRLRTDRLQRRVAEILERSFKRTRREQAALEETTQSLRATLNARHDDHQDETLPDWPV